MKLVNDRHAVKARMVAPNDNGFLVLAADVGGWIGPFSRPHRARGQLLGRVSDLAARLEARDDVEEATVFRGTLRAPGMGKGLLDQRGIRHARYDVVVLVRTSDVDATEDVRADSVYQSMVGAINQAATRVHHVAARNRTSLGDVDHRPNHAFLFNYFYGDDIENLLDVWEYTAGWFQVKTGLPNSTLMQPLPGEPFEYGIVNHASWPSLATFLPSLIFRPTFRSFVLANFAANGIAAQPIIYRRVQRSHR